MKGFPSREQVERIKERYPVGTIVELTADMNDPYSKVEVGMQGEVVNVDSIGTLHMSWQNGSGLGLVVGEDSFKVISKPQEQEMEKPKLGMGGMSL